VVCFLLGQRVPLRRVQEARVAHLPEKGLGDGHTHVLALSLQFVEATKLGVQLLGRSAAKLDDVIQQRKFVTFRQALLNQGHCSLPGKCSSAGEGV
jgi:hypothetical protein